MDLTTQVAKVLYSSSRTGKLELKISEKTSENGEKSAEIELIAPAMSPQFVVVLDIKAKKYHIYDLTGTPGDSGVITLKEPYPYYTDDYGQFTCYIWNVKFQKKAEMFGKIFPFQVGRSPSIKVKRLGDLISVFGTGSNGSYLAVVNTGQSNKYIVDDSTMFCLKPNVPMHIQTSTQLNCMTVRDSETPSKVAYRDLTYKEREIYIPKEIIFPRSHSSVTSGKTNQIKTFQTHCNTIHDEWIIAEDYLYRGTLTYVPTRDKVFHMMDENGHSHYYDVDHFRPVSATPK